MDGQDRDLGAELRERVAAAATERRPLSIRGGGSKAFYTGSGSGEALDLRGHRGIVSYEPTELVVTARAGTPLAELEAALAERAQILPFEPPHFGAAATVGGAIAAGFSGPRRFALGTVRDAVLGVECLNGRGQRLRFGGVVMKNVAGYDLSRLLVGSMGRLACLLEVSLKVQPAPEQERTHALELGPDAATDLIYALTTEALPLTATAWLGGRLYLRMSGSARVLDAAQRRLGGEVIADGPAFWRELRDHSLPFFQGPLPLWRLDLPPRSTLADLGGAILSEHAGQVVWLRSDEAAEGVLARAAALGGHARAFRSSAGPAWAPATRPQALAALQERIKLAFDPYGIFTGPHCTGA